MVDRCSHAAFLQHELSGVHVRHHLNLRHRHQLLLQYGDGYYRLLDNNALHSRFPSQGINPSVIATAIAYTSMCAYMTMAAAGPAPLLLGREGIETKFIWTRGLITLGAYVIVAVVFFSILGLVM